MRILEQGLSRILSLTVVCLICFSVGGANAYEIAYEYYLNADCSGCTAISGEATLTDGPKVYSAEMTHTGDPNAGNFATVKYFANLDTGSVGAYAYSTGGILDYWPYGWTAAGRVDRIYFELELTFEVPIGVYPDGVSVSLSGAATGILEAEYKATARTEYYINFGGSLQESPLMSVGMDEVGTFPFDDPILVSKQIVSPGTELTEPHEYSVLLKAGLWNTLASSFLLLSSPDSITGAAEVDVYNGGNRIQFDEVIVPEGVTWHTDTGVFLDEGNASAVGNVMPRPKLKQNYPNPFNPLTRISYYLPETTHVDLAIYDVAGKLIRVLENGGVDQGNHPKVWNGLDNSGRAVASGVYYYRLHAGEVRETKIMTLVR